MDTISAMAMGTATRGEEPMVFDWDKAARIIKKSGATNASAGLRNDWEWTGGAILRNGNPVPCEDKETFLSSTWATPELQTGGDEPIACYRMNSEVPDWGSDTFWPESALKILGGNQ